MANKLLLDLGIKEKKSKCKGLYWRGTNNIFSDDSGRVKASRELRLLKKTSCTGCSDCGWFLDYLHEDISFNPEMSLLGNIEDGKIYTFKVNSSQDWESGNWEIDEIEFVEVKEE